MNILQINSSIQSDAGNSSRLASELSSALSGGAAVATRDLARHPVPHLDAARFGAFLTPEAERSAEQQAVVAYSDALIEELREADVLVLGLPMYNFGVPSQLKAWFDHVARAGVTFRYTATGPEGLLKGKKAWVVAARGGRYEGTAKDSQSAHVRDFLGFLGITDVEFVYAEGLAIDAATREASIAQARNRIAEIAGTVEAVAA